MNRFNDQPSVTVEKPVPESLASDTNRKATQTLNRFGLQNADTLSPKALKAGYAPEINLQADRLNYSLIEHRSDQNDISKSPHLNLAGKAAARKELSDKFAKRIGEISDKAASGLQADAAKIKAKTPAGPPKPTDPVGTLELQGCRNVLRPMSAAARLERVTAASKAGSPGSSVVAAILHSPIHGDDLIPQHAQDAIRKNWSESNYKDEHDALDAISECLGVVNYNKSVALKELGPQTMPASL